ncbi:hypothetical protein ACHQM5_011797 [Ranunculus cassubicifolius]
MFYGEGATKMNKTVSPIPLHTFQVHPNTKLNRLFALIYICALIALFYHHIHTLLQCTTTISTFLHLSLLLTDAIFAFMWVTMQVFRMCPIKRKTYPENLLSVLDYKDYPGLDVFICTADPYKEPPINVVNTALSVLAYDYPTDKISVYVSDDGGSVMSLFAFIEAAKFATHWLPFCREKNIMERCPEAYFGSIQANTCGPESEKIKVYIFSPPFNYREYYLKILFSPRIHPRPDNPTRTRPADSGFGYSFLGFVSISGPTRQTR